MVISISLDQTFIQNERSCVLASYAAVAKYFTGVDIKNVFTEYCKAHDILYADFADAEIKSSDHLDKICKEKNWKGYQLIDHLHKTSDNEYFSNNRKHFSSSFSPTESLTQEKFAELVKDLLSGDSLANVLVGASSPYHSKTIGYDPDNGLFVHDTQAAKNEKLSFIVDKLPIDFREYILYQSV